MTDKIAYIRTQLIGGGVNAVDGINGKPLLDGDYCFAPIYGHIQYEYTLVAASGATEKAPFVISPDANAGDKRWHLKTPYTVYADPTVADQGAATAEGYRSIKDLVDAIGATRIATIALEPTGTGNTTTFTLTNNETITSNITLRIEPGAIIDGAGTLTINGPFEAGLYQVFDTSGGGSVVFAEGQKGYGEWFGADGDGTTDDRAAFQALNDALATNGGGILLEGKTYIIGDSGSTVTYRATTTNYGISIDSDVYVRGRGITSILKADASADCALVVCDNTSNNGFYDFKIDGNEANQTNDNGQYFGLYLYSCDNFIIDNLWFKDVYSNTFELIECTDGLVGKTYHIDTGDVFGGGVQVEDSSNITFDSVLGDTYDDLVSIIAYGANTTDITFNMINGTSDQSRVLLIAQANSPSGGTQRTISNIFANINSHACANGQAAAMLKNAGIYKNINVRQIDRASSTAFQIHPFYGANAGEVYNSTFDITSYDAIEEAITVTPNDIAGMKIENCHMRATVVNPNTGDAANKQAIDLRLGDYWTLDLNVNYTTGLANPALGAVQLGGTGTNDLFRYSTVKGIITGGDTNLRLNKCTSVNLSDLILLDTESATDISLNITANATDTKLGVVTTDNKINDSGTTTHWNNDLIYVKKGEPGGGTPKTLTAAMLLGKLIDEDPAAAAVDWTTDTAANIVGAIQGAYVGLSFECVIYNDATAASAEAVTLKPGAGVTFHGVGHGNDVVLTEGTDPMVKVLFRLTNVTAASEAVDAYVFTEL